MKLKSASTPTGRLFIAAVPTDDDDAKKAVVTQCKGKLPEADAKADFAAACSKGSADRAKACDCMWKKLRTKSSVEEISAGAVDIKKAGLETCKTGP